jgi:hypothetical protein
MRPTIMKWQPIWIIVAGLIIGSPHEVSNQSLILHKQHLP